MALAFDGFRKNDWTRGPVTVHILDLGRPEACVHTLVQSFSNAVHPFRRLTNPQVALLFRAEDGRIASCQCNDVSLLCRGA